jgi:hypothetical protein
MKKLARRKAASSALLRNDKQKNKQRQKQKQIHGFFVALRMTTIKCDPNDNR